jgi:hypothetical protein
MNYTWNCRRVELIPTDGTNEKIVAKVNWKLFGEIENYGQVEAGKVVLDTSNIESFIEFSDLTHENIISWVQETLGEDEVNTLKSNLAAKVNAMAAEYIEAVVEDPPPPPAEEEEE